MMADLHALLGAADIPGPYVLVGHSAGGMIVRLYASTYPDDVVGMVLLDTTHEDVWPRFHQALTPAQVDTVRSAHGERPRTAGRLSGGGTVVDCPVDGCSQRQPGTPGSKGCSHAPDALGCSRPRHPVCRAHSWLADSEMEGIMLALQHDLAQLVPDARLIIATESGHNIHQDQPDLVIDAIQQVVAAVRDLRAWVASPGGG
jgi:pimeloyl-ACP methyl ester carboxylesterase